MLFPVEDLEIHSYTVRTTEKRYGEVTAKPRRSIGMVRCSKKEDIMQPVFPAHRSLRTYSFRVMILYSAVVSGGILGVKSRRRKGNDP